MSLQSASTPTARPMCFRCRKAASTCYCAQLSPTPTHTQFVLLQHPRESWKAIGTARMAHLVLPDSWLLEGLRFLENPVIQKLMSDPGSAPAVLYPGTQALNLDQAKPGDRAALFPDGKRPVIFVLDGTWWAAKVLLRLNPWLLNLPRVSFDSLERSEYDLIRKQPEAYCLSTLEAVSRVVELLEPGSLAPKALLEPFKRMVALQYDFGKFKAADRGLRRSRSSRI